VTESQVGAEPMGGGLRGRFARMWRARCDRLATRQVLVLGDSHVRVFEHWWFMWALPWVRWHIVYVPGGTAGGLYNPRAVTQAYARLTQALREVPSDLVVLNLGEVDTGYTIWVRAQRDGIDPRQAMAHAANNYIRFIREIHSGCRLLVLSAPLPTLSDDFEPTDDVLTTRKAVSHSQEERTALTLAFNDRISAACADLGVPYLDDREASLAPHGLVWPQWQREGGPDHHYNRKTYAKWLASGLKPFLK